MTFPLSFNLISIDAVSFVPGMLAWTTFSFIIFLAFFKSFLPILPKASLIEVEDGGHFSKASGLQKGCGGW